MGGSLSSLKLHGWFTTACLQATLKYRIISLKALLKSGAGYVRERFSSRFLACEYEG